MSIPDINLLETISELNILKVEATFKTKLKFKTLGVHKFLSAVSAVTLVHIEYTISSWGGGGGPEKNKKTPPKKKKT
jgi:hypothetical protein